VTRNSASVSQSAIRKGGIVKGRVTNNIVYCRVSKSGCTIVVATTEGKNSQSSDEAEPDPEVWESRHVLSIERIDIGLSSSSQAS
jgi:hypothetical protein